MKHSMGGLSEVV